MFCVNCGKPVLEGSKFCGNCGVQINRDIAAAPAIANAPEMIRPVITSEEETTPAAVESGPAQAASTENFLPGAELYRLRMVDKIAGKSNFATNLGTGTLFVYDNGLKFSGVLDAHVGRGWVGLIVSTAIDIAGSYDPNTYPLEQIRELSVGRRLAVYNTLVISMNNGDTVSFCPNAPGSSEPQQIISLLKPYMDKLK